MSSTHASALSGSLFSSQLWTWMHEPFAPPRLLKASAAASSA
jgi:hypothetical protein